MIESPRSVVEVFDLTVDEIDQFALAHQLSAKELVALRRLREAAVARHAKAEDTSAHQAGLREPLQRKLTRAQEAHERRLAKERLVKKNLTKRKLVARARSRGRAS